MATTIKRLTYDDLEAIPRSAPATGMRSSTGSWS